jgi:methyl-accepting chemotaxis protein
MDNSQSQTLLLVFTAVVAVSLLLQAGSMVAMLLGARKAQKKVAALVDDVRLHALPVIMSSREVIHELLPKMRTIVDNLEATSTTLRAKTDQLGGVVEDVAHRAQAQAVRVDDLVKGTLDQITYAAHAVEAGISMPVRQVSGIINGLRAGVEVLWKKTPGNHLDPEDDLFV